MFSKYLSIRVYEFFVKNRHVQILKCATGKQFSFQNISNISFISDSHAKQAFEKELCYKPRLKSQIVQPTRSVKCRYFPLLLFIPQSIGKCQNPAGNYMFKVNKRRHCRRSGIFIVNFEHTSHLFLVFLLLTLNM